MTGDGRGEEGEGSTRVSATSDRAVADHGRRWPATSRQTSGGGRERRRPRSRPDPGSARSAEINSNDSVSDSVSLSPSEPPAIMKPRRVSRGGRCCGWRGVHCEGGMARGSVGARPLALEIVGVGSAQVQPGGWPASDPCVAPSTAARPCQKMTRGATRVRRTTRFGGGQGPPGAAGAPAAHACAPPRPPRHVPPTRPVSRPLVGVGVRLGG